MKIINDTFNGALAFEVLTLPYNSGVRIFDFSLLLSTVLKSKHQNRSTLARVVFGFRIVICYLWPMFVQLKPGNSGVPELQHATSGSWKRAANKEASGSN